MSKRGISSVVGIVLISLLGIVAVGIFLNVYLNSVDKVTSNDAALCFGIDVGIDTCVIFPPNHPLNPSPNYALLMSVERFSGRGQIRDLKYIVKDDLGNENAYDPADITPGLIDRNYTDFKEYAFKGAAVQNIPQLPDTVAVSVVVGDSLTVCTPTKQPVKCNLV